jgi:hypothetical protein
MTQGRVRFLSTLLEAFTVVLLLLSSFFAGGVQVMEWGALLRPHFASWLRYWPHIYSQQRRARLLLPGRHLLSRLGQTAAFNSRPVDCLELN